MQVQVGDAKRTAIGIVPGAVAFQQLVHVMEPKMTDSELIEVAKALVRPLPLSRQGMDAATVGSALLSKHGNLYTGVSLHLSCGIGFCAEHAAVAEMLKAGETGIETIVACSESGVLPPCGRCRELLAQIDRANFQCRVLLGNGKAVLLRELLPYHWLDAKIED
jgi:cytidine deaminase